MAASTASRSYPLFLFRLTITLLMILFLSLSYVSSKSDVADQRSSSAYMSSRERVADEALQRKKVLGSRPPTCVNKCMSCRPCVATLVIPPHRVRTTTTGTTATTTHANYKQSTFHRDDDTYYLLSWKCKCGDKIFQP